MYDRFYDDVEIGASETYGSVTVSESLIAEFADLSGDHHPLHVDAEFAKRTRYGQPIAHGFLVLSLASGLFPMDPDAVVAFYGMDGVRFHKPTFIGDTLRARLTVLDKVDRPGGARGRSPRDGTRGGVVETALEMINQREEVVAVAVLRILVASRAHAASGALVPR